MRRPTREELRIQSALLRKRRSSTWMARFATSFHFITEFTVLVAIVGGAVLGYTLRSFVHG